MSAHRVAVTAESILPRQRIRGDPYGSPLIRSPCNARSARVEYPRGVRLELEELQLAEIVRGRLGDLRAGTIAWHDLRAAVTQRCTSGGGVVIGHVGTPGPQLQSRAGIHVSEQRHMTWIDKELLVLRIKGYPAHIGEPDIEPGVQRGGRLVEPGQGVFAAVWPRQCHGRALRPAELCPCWDTQLV